MVVECGDPLSPVELDHHVGIKIGIALGTWQVVVSLNQSVDGGVDSGEEVFHLSSGVVCNISEGFYFGKPLNIASVVDKPDGSMEGHFIILDNGFDTMSSIAFESLVKMVSNILGKSYDFEDNYS